MDQNGRTISAGMAPEPAEPGLSSLMFATDVESIAMSHYQPSIGASETVYSASLMGSMMSSSDLYLPCHVNDDETAIPKSVRTTTTTIQSHSQHDKEDEFSSREKKPTFNGNMSRDVAVDVVDDGGHMKETSQATIQTTDHHDDRHSSNNIVDWDAHDPEYPRNWSQTRKVFTAIASSAMILAVSFGSTITANHPPIDLVTNLTVSLWLAGFCLGPVTFGPLSQKHGHRLPTLISLLGLSVFQIPAALGTNPQASLVSQFLSGAFGSGVLVLIPTILDEICPKSLIQKAIVSGMCINLGAVLGPVAGVHTGPLWTSWTVFIVTSSLFVLHLLITPETSSRILLRRKAKQLRLQTGNWALHARSEEETPIKVWRLAFHVYIAKPTLLFLTEPTLFFVTVHILITYAILYLVILTAFPTAFIAQRGWSSQTASLPLISIALGVILGCALFCLFVKTDRKRRPTHAEAKSVLPMMLLGAVMLPISLLWFGWSMNVHWASQTVAGFFVGVGVILVFVAGTGYLYHVFDDQRVNSAIAAHLVVRSLVGASVPLWAGRLFDQLSVQWASSAMALVCAVMILVPVVLMNLGLRLRGRRN
ncbi:major facilitator superfamily domain-containing protein [Apodospora peruviana]|uniref:Major facilitator superfamily domain-containing protein n=1 Tax=Apodospora peruviana TaxID=516989 RepID=A0AAE0LYQ0_9PEZI|nr:major facilitator superfamily domain-containing protein [Apodospora peruviana]